MGHVTGSLERNNKENFGTGNIFTYARFISMVLNHRILNSSFYRLVIRHAYNFFFAVFGWDFLKYRKNFLSVLKK